MKLLNKFRRKSLEDVLEELSLKKDIAESTVVAIEFLNPELNGDNALTIYATTLLTMVSVEELEKFRDSVVSLADTKVKEVSDLYSIYERSN